MQQQLEQFLSRPSAEGYLRVRARLLARRRRPPATALWELTELFSDGRFAEVRSEMEKLFPLWALSPRLYWIGSAAALELGDISAAELDRFLYQSCLEGILATGQGRRSDPYVITYASDLAVVLDHLGVTAQKQRLIRGPQGLCDVAEIGSRRRLWFHLGEGIRDDGQARVARSAELPSRRTLGV
jgi:hypothetical protein